jgi:hypothetical protein
LANSGEFKVIHGKLPAHYFKLFVKFLTNFTEFTQISSN